MVCSKLKQKERGNGCRREKGSRDSHRKQVVSCIMVRSLQKHGGRDFLILVLLSHLRLCVIFIFPQNFPSRSPAAEFRVARKDMNRKIRAGKSCTELYLKDKPDKQKWQAERLRSRRTLKFKRNKCVRQIR